MKTIGKAIFFLTLASSAALATAAPSIPSELSDGANVSCTAAQTKKSIQEAHTAGQFNVIAQCYEKQQSAYLQQAAEEKQEWSRRSQQNTSVSAKYPKPEDSARYLYEYYSSRASEAKLLSVKYSQLAEQASSVAMR
jgi:hypothetical protein